MRVPTRQISLGCRPSDEVDKTRFPGGRTANRLLTRNAFHHRSTVMTLPGRSRGFCAAGIDGFPGTTAFQTPVASSTRASGRRCPGCKRAWADTRTGRRPRACATGFQPPDVRRTHRTAVTWPSARFPTTPQRTTTRRFWSNTCPVNRDFEIHIFKDLRFIIIENHFFFIYLFIFFKLIYRK